ncbi:hypothetical protein SAMD00019534_114930 [Acytostelium subglobosum LB1]|uniref:hypothetical protein n=1 Tax=Acytostelium subglobosum LB1 TaxID=1410327 RepID=UPI0006447B32|nr:hypothetical protein SAMD00019534_114930 [Acytostelium subglobosum LB1]GAM28317.1 hypothetical protein SAMD00019534_114930 [Acytostelium subglobosum LB1]|eukprot:XP_012748634.1 hypothetical protein SAMD00019534_114930 [Acytostelium subglobosum LB1]
MVGAVLWAAADVISDGVIGEHSPSTMKSSSDQSASSDIEAATQVLDLLSDTKEDTMRTKREKDGGGSAHHKDKDSDTKLSGEQDALISGAVMLLCGAFLHYYYGTAHIVSFYAHDHMAPNGLPMIPPNTVYIAAFVSGIFQAFSLIYLLKAFESSSSTIIVPLMQLNSLFVLPMSIVLSVLSHYFPTLSTFDQIISPVHFLAFVLIFIGGFYPAIEGEWSQFSRSFWRQPAVTQVILSDFLIAIYYLIVSFCTNETGGMTSMSFLVISIYGNATTFLFLVVFVGRYRRSANELLVMRPKYILLSSLGEMFSMSGYFFVSISYHLYYNSGVVSATEGALNQLFNLLLAIFLKKVFNFGREVKRIREKLYSCAIVSVGLVLTST